MGSWKKKLGLDKNYVHTAVAVSFRDGEFDFVEEPEGTLSLPKGSVERTDSSLRFATERELKEELGLVGKVAKTPFDIRVRRNRMYHCFVVSDVEFVKKGQLDHYRLSMADVLAFHKDDLLVGDYIIDICQTYLLQQNASDNPSFLP